jgi:hypothetical protein
MTYIADPECSILFFSILVNKLGGEVTITQEDIDNAAYGTLLETADEDGVTLKVVARTKQ